MGVFDLVGAAAKGAKKAAPFFSKADVVLDELPRTKGLGNEFLAELVKKGAKPTELKERGIEKALKDKPKMTKAEVQKLFEEKAPPRVQENVLGDSSATQYDRYKTPGGENYREILLKLPEMQNIQPPPDTSKWAVVTKSRSPYSGARDLQILDEQNNVVGQRLGFQGSDSDAIREVLPLFLNWKARTQDQVNYRSSHYPNDLNLLAHIRVQDFKTPDGKKVLLVDEVQSDWHQEGRNRGYKTDSDRTAAQVERELNVVFDKRARLLGEATMLPDSEMARFIETNEEIKRLGEQAEKLRGEWNSLLNKPEGVPDAPFKKNWHELAMKRVLDYAAENGYDTVAITPGAEQAKRYDLSKQISKINYDKFNSGQNEFKAWDKDGKKVFQKYGASQEEVADYIGKEAAEKLFAATPKDNHMGGERYSLIGEDLQVGGEGMKGFYDKILPDYLNNYGKKYGAQMGELQLQTGQEMSRGPSGTDMVPSYSPTMQSFHSFDITPQMREEIQTKGQPMYGKVAMPVLEGLAVGSGAATIAPEVFDTNNEQSVQNPVHFTENPDAMLLELMQRN